MVSVILTILLSALSYILGSLIGWDRTVKMQRKIASWLKKSKTTETPAK